MNSALEPSSACAPALAAATAATHSLNNHLDLLVEVNRIVERLQHTEAELQEQTKLLRTVLDESPDLIVLKDWQGNFLLANKPVADFYGTTPEAMVGHHDGDFGVPPEMAEAFRLNVISIMAHGRTEIVHEDSRDARTGEINHFRSIKKPFMGPDGKPRILVIAHDITDIRRAQLRAEESERRLQYALEATGDAVWDWSLATETLTLSQRWCAMLGYRPEELSRTLDDFWHCLLDAERPEIEQALQDCLAGRTETYLHEHHMRCRDGRMLWVQDRGRVVERDAQGRATRMVGSVADVTDKKYAQDLIWHQANFDALTGLPNRHRFHDRLHQLIAQSDRTDQPLAVLMLDLDEFKETNDSLGHAWGDLLLQQAAQRLQSCVHEPHLVARLGGDEFMMVVTGWSELEQVTSMADTILHTLRQPFPLGADLVYLTGSLGVAVYPQDGHDITELLRSADQAMYAAKRQGRNRCQYFTATMQTAALERMRLVADLRTALEQHQFHLCYQPIVELATQRICKAEALVRWRHPTRGLVSPVEFISVLESIGQIHVLGDWVLREATRQTALWRTQHADFQVSVNISPLQFQNQHLDLTGWLDHLRRHGLDGRSLVLEITEGLLMEISDTVMTQMLDIRDAGIQVALDDFGTGYSSLAYLNRLDIDYLKIDRSFIQHLRANSPELALCEGIVVMAHTLGLKVVAEGIETQEQCDLLLAAGCDYGQGYWFSRPVDAAAFSALMSG